MSNKRPGVESAIALAKLRNPTIWNQVYSHSNDVISKIGELTKLQANADQLGKELQTQNRESITKSQLLNVVIPWKFSVGKPRHALTKQLASNDESAVSAATKEAIAKVREIPDCTTAKEDDIKSAIESITILRGVGPATASVILSLARPDLFAYMYDEVIDCFLPKRTYTLKVYVALNSECTKLARQLNEETSGSWTPSKVATTLWSAARAKASGMDVVANTSKAEKKSSRKDNNNEESSGPATKRRRRAK